MLDNLLVVQMSAVTVTVIATNADKWFSLT